MEKGKTNNKKNKYHPKVANDILKEIAPLSRMSDSQQQDVATKIVNAEKKKESKKINKPNNTKENVSASAVVKRNSADMRMASYPLTNVRGRGYLMPQNKCLKEEINWPVLSEDISSQLESAGIYSSVGFYEEAVQRIEQVKKDDEKHEVQDSNTSEQNLNELSYETNSGQSLIEKINQQEAYYPPMRNREFKTKKESRNAIMNMSYEGKLNGGRPQRESTITRESLPTTSNSNLSYKNALEQNKNLQINIKKFSEEDFPSL